MLYPRGQTSILLIIDFTYSGVAYSAVLYSLHTVNHIFNTKLNDRDYAMQLFITTVY